MNTFWFPKTSLSDPDYTPVVFNFETTADLLALDSVQKAASPGAEFVMSDGYLMVLTKEGFEWWVVGRIGKPEEIDLPKWSGPKVYVRLEDGTHKIATDISSICGDRIVLKDGTIALKVGRFD